MKIEEKHIAFLEDIIKIPFFKIDKPLDELVEKKPDFLADYMAMIYRRRPIEYNINNLIRDYLFFGSSVFDFAEGGENVKKLEERAKKIYSKHFPKDKQQDNFNDLFHRLRSRHCLMYEECKGIPGGNLGIGGCDGSVWCSVYNLGGSHGSMGNAGNFRAQGYNYLYEVPKDLMLKEMRKLYNNLISFDNQRKKIGRKIMAQTPRYLTVGAGK